MGLRQKLSKTFVEMFSVYIKLTKEKWVYLRGESFKVSGVKLEFQYEI